MATPYQPVRGVAEVRMQYVLSGELCENVYHVEHGSLDPWPLVDMEDLASTFADWEDATAKAVRSTAAFLQNITVTDLTSLTSDRLTRPIVPAIEGTVAGDASPNNVTFAVKADVHNRGRGKNGRVFWIGLAESQTAGNSIVAAQRDAIVTALNTLSTNVTGLNPAYKMVVVHRVVGGIRPAEADWSQIFAFVATDDTLDSQKNRLPNHRRRRSH